MDGFELLAVVVFFLIGYWVVDVENEARVIEIASQIVAYAGVVEVRPVPHAPPEM